MPLVLVVNGETTSRMLWCDLFEERGYEVRAMDGGMDLDELIFGPDLVVLDIDSLPSTGQGLHLIERIRAATPDIPIVAISDWSLTSVREEAHDLGASVCVRKPVNYVVFLKLVDAMMHQLRTATQAS